MPLVMAANNYKSMIEIFISESFIMRKKYTHTHTQMYNSLIAMIDLLIKLHFSHWAGSSGCLAIDSFLSWEGLYMGITKQL